MGEVCAVASLCNTGEQGDTGRGEVGEVPEVLTRAMEFDSTIRMSRVSQLSIREGSCGVVSTRLTLGGEVNPIFTLDIEAKKIGESLVHGP